MRVLIFALLCLVSFGSVKEQNQRLKKTNSALRQALRSLTVEQDHETAIGEEKFWTRRVGETMMIDGDKITVTVLGVTGSVRLGINGPKEISVHRMEIYYPDQETAVGMLIMNRNVGESIMIGNEGSVIKVTVNGVKGDQVRLAIDAPEGVSVYREEDWMRVQAEDGNNGLMAGRETKIGADKHGSKHGRETKIGADKHGSKHESEVGWVGHPGNHDPANVGNYYYGEAAQSKTGRETKLGAHKHGSKHESEVGWVGHPGNHDPANVGNYYYGEAAKSKTESEVGWVGHPGNHDPANVGNYYYGEAAQSKTERAVGLTNETYGTVQWFNESKGYGFLLQDEGGADVFVHHRSIQGDVYPLTAGQRVSFMIVEGQKGPTAENVILL